MAEILNSFSHMPRLFDPASWEKQERPLGQRKIPYTHKKNVML